MENNIIGFFFFFFKVCAEVVFWSYCVTVANRGVSKPLEVLKKEVGKGKALL